MASINVQDVPDALVDALEAEAQREHRTVSAQVVHLLEQTLRTEKTQSILALRGLGKEAWAGIDAAEHVRAERDAWT